MNIVKALGILLVAYAGLLAPGLAAQAPYGQASERPPEISTEAFAARSGLSSLRMSPNGTRVAGRLSQDGQDYVVLLNLAGISESFYAVGADRDLEGLRWAGPDRLILNVSGTVEFRGYERRFTRLFVLDLDSSEFIDLGRKVQTPFGGDLVFVDPDGAYALVSVQRSSRQYPNVYRYDLATGDREEVQEIRKGVWDWFADTNGVIRAGLGWRNGRLRTFYRKAAGEDLELVSKVESEEFEKGDLLVRSWEILRIDTESDLAYVLDEDESGRVGLRCFDMLKQEVVDTVHQMEGHDIDGAIFDSEGKPIGVTYVDDRPLVHWLDPQWAQWQTLLDQALSEEQVWVASTAEDKSQMLVRAGGAADPGAYYLFSPAKNTVGPFAELRPYIDFQQLAQPRAIAYTARDGTLIHGYLTLPRGREPKGLPLIVMPHGGPYGIRDTLTYNGEVQLLANRGYAVLQPNYRGSGGYGDNFYRLGVGQIGRAMQDDLDDAVEWAVGEGIADPSRVCLVGGSYGGYAALWGVLRNPERYRCAASWAGVTDWESMLRYDNQFFSRKVGRQWKDLVEGDDFPLAEVSPVAMAATLERPVLLAQGEEDVIVPPFQYHRFRRALEEAGKPVELLLIDDEGHSFSEPENEQAWYDALTAFLERHNPAD